MQQVAIKQQKYYQREERIITTTLALLKESSFLELKMSEVAKTTGCSMGAIYSHFFSKEDLLIACTAQVMNIRCQQIMIYLQRVEQPLDRILTVLFYLWNENIANPHYYNLEQLSSNPSVWQRASDFRNGQFNRVADHLAATVRGNCAKVLEKELQLSATEEMIEKLLMSIAGLSRGIHQFMQSGYGSSFAHALPGNRTRLHMESLAVLLRGWGIQRDDLVVYLERIHDQTLSLINNT